MPVVIHNASDDNAIMTCKCISEILDNPTACECEAAGWCARHQVKKTEHWRMLCRKHHAYFQMWEEGHGPGQVITAPSGTETYKTVRIGDRLAAFLARIGIRKKVGGNCGCDKRQSFLNRIGDKLLSRFRRVK